MNAINSRFIKILDEMLPPLKKDCVNVLMIDDMVQHLNAFKGGFRREANIFLASNKVEALNVVNNNKIDLIFCDYSMPNDMGSDILSEILHKYPNIKSTIVTAYTTPEIVEEFKDKTGVVDFLSKPYEWSDIIQRITGAKELNKLC